MTERLKTSLVNACRALLRPIALVLLRGGITWKEFAEMSKSVFVSVATDEFGIRGRPTNVSRGSILTGISRKEVKRQRDLLAEGGEPVSTKTTDATRLLSGWHQDRNYIDDDGTPLPLPLNGPAPSFESLFALYGGDTPMQTLLRELKNAASIGEDGDALVALRRFHMPAAMDEANIRFFGSNLFDPEIDPGAVDAFHEFLDVRGQQFLEEIDDWLAAHRNDSSDENSSPVRLGLGAYAIEGPLPRGTLS